MGNNRIRIEAPPEGGLRAAAAQKGVADRAAAAGGGAHRPQRPRQASGAAGAAAPRASFLQQMDRWEPTERRTEIIDRMADLKMEALKLQGPSVCLLAGESS